MPSEVREMMKVTDEGIAMADSDVNLNMNIAMTVAQHLMYSDFAWS